MLDNEQPKHIFKNCFVATKQKTFYHHDNVSKTWKPTKISLY